MNLREKMTRYESGRFQVGNNKKHGRVFCCLLDCEKNKMELRNIYFLEFISR